MLILNEGNTVADTPTEPRVIQPGQNTPADTSWNFTAESDDAALMPAPASVPAGPISWTASEYIEHTKGLGWFVGLGLILSALVVTIYFIGGKDIMAAGMVGVAGLAFGIFAARPPRVLNYSIDAHGLQIDTKHYSFQEFKSFAVLEEGPLPSVLLLPLKRFLPPITVFYDPKSEDAILNALGSYLPHEDKEPDAVDRLMSKIRF